MTEAKHSPNLPRRRFVQGLAAGGVVLGMAPMLTQAQAQARAASPGTLTGDVPVLTGSEFDLVIDETPVNFTGKARMA
ncbi:MAG: twin-arginine translocation signal domain-containing protein, partial [Oceanisphaera sp.]|nr:twin-arginine translocation signal domain-containing protein [Oceanisphaera sp.]